MKKENRFSKTILSIISIGLLTSVLGACVLFMKRSAVNEETIVSTLTVDSVANQVFIEMIGTIDELNTGITIERLKIFQIEGLPTPSPNYISLLVLNHTEESVIFNDIGFDIQVFEYDSKTFSWEKLALRYWPEKKKKVLPPKLEKFDFDILNTWEILDGDIMNATSKSLRIFILGMGAITGKSYGAFLDLTLHD